MKRLILPLCCLLAASALRAQVLFQERFGNYTLTGDAAHITNYSNWNSSSLPTDTLLYKYNSPLPFGKPAFRNDAWIAARLELTGDTVAMVAGYLQGGVYTVDKWLLLPPMSINMANVFLSWESKVASRASFEAYQVLLATSNVNNPAAADFTTVLYSAGMDTNASFNNFIRRSVPLSAWNGQTVRIAFRYKNGAIANANYCLMLDDVLVENVPVASEAALKEVSMPRYIPKGSNTLGFTVTNNGHTPISSLEVGYTLNGGTPVTATIPVSPALPYGQSVKLSFPAAVAFANAGSAQVKVFLRKINGNNSTTLFNDTAVRQQFVYDYKPVRRLLLENITGAWCSACPDVSHELNDLYKGMNRDTVLVASVHDASTTYGDPMTIGLSYPLMAAYHGSSYPQVLFGRRSYNDLFKDYRFYWYLTPQAPSKSEVRNYVSEFSPVDLKITNRSYNATTRQLSFTVEAKFVTDDNGAYNINAYLVEDSCWSSNFGWAQYNGGNTDVTSPYYGQGNPIPNYKHRNVLIAALDNVWGNSSVIPATQTAGQTYSKQYSYTLPQPTANINRYHPDRIQILGIVQKRGTELPDKEIVNVAKAPMKTTSVGGVPQRLDGVSVYPNPSTGDVYVSVQLETASDLSVELTNTLGQVVYGLPRRRQSAGKEVYRLPLQTTAPGVYYVRVKSGDAVYTEKIVVE